MESWQRYPTAKKLWAADEQSRLSEALKTATGVTAKSKEWIGRYQLFVKEEWKKVTVEEKNKWEQKAQEIKDHRMPIKMKQRYVYTD